MINRKNGVLTGITWDPFAGVFPGHRLPTVYQYNSLNQVLQQYSPDGDTSVFFYDRLGRLTVSQNKEQKENASYSGDANRFSYTKYDGLGRITEVGEKSEPDDDIRDIDMLDTTAVKNWIADGIDRQITKTIYDIPVNTELQTYSTSRKRVTASIYLENADDEEGDSTLYSYDINGNVNTLLQHVKALVAVDPTNGRKRIDYDYDLVSGKVNMVAYQHGKGDQFYYKYGYDADNRVVSSFSSRDKLVWTEDAAYTYYLHGPLARMELGQYKVQGIDYAYTLQGWLKGINSYALDSTKDIGQDSKPATMFARVSRDVYGFSLGYYNNDYAPVGTDANAFALTYEPVDPVSSTNSGNQLFNGNISYTTLALSKIRNSTTAGYTYNYDQLNRLTEMNRHNIAGGATTWDNGSMISAYRERISYDANGNILKYLRHGGDTTGLPEDMDSLGYKYNRDVNGNLVNNRLNHVRDPVGSTNYSVDIDDQSADNYTYDLIGNLKSDAAEQLDNVRWTVYGKINQIVKTVSGTTVIDYGYDPGGNRTYKKVNINDTITSTFYVRDAQGNVMAIYSKNDEAAIRWDEQHLYGSSRLGMWRWDTIVPAAAPVVGEETYIYDSLLLGSRSYELSNHLGNVLSTISDKKIGHEDSDTVNYYIAEVLSQNDYYPFGMMMPGRKYSIENGYRYGFNRHENDNEIKGEGNTVDFGGRSLYDPRLGRFISVDPKSRSIPWLSPYSFAANNPIFLIDYGGNNPVIPPELWKGKSYLHGFLAGFADGFLETGASVVAGGFTLALAAVLEQMDYNKCMAEWGIFCQFYYEMKDNAKNSYRAAVALMSSADVRSEFVKNIKIALSDYFKDFLGSDANAGYKHGQAVFAVVSVFMGTTELKGLLEGGKLTMKTLRKVYGARGDLYKGMGAIINAGRKTLSWADVKVTRKGIDVVKKHLARFGDDAPNNKMIERLEGILSGKIEASDYDLKFYTHELREYVRYRKMGYETGGGDDYELWRKNHSATLEDYNIPDDPNQLYHPEAQKLAPDEFKKE